MSLLLSPSFGFSHSLSLSASPFMPAASLFFCLPISLSLLRFSRLPLPLACRLSPSPPHRFVLGAFFDVSLSYVRARVCCAGIVHVRRTHGHVSARARVYTHYNGLLVCTGRPREDLRASLARRKEIFVVPAVLIDEAFFLFLTLSLFRLCLSCLRLLFGLWRYGARQF